MRNTKKSSLPLLQYTTGGDEIVLVNNMIKIIVCVRQSASGDINPFDASAYEAALRIPSSHVILLSMGPMKVYDFLKKLTRLGAKEAYLLSDSAFAGADTLATSYTLSLAIKKLGADFVFCGRQTTDGDTGQVGPQLAIRLGYDLTCQAMSISGDTADGKRIRVTTRMGEEKLLTSPALITVEKIYNLRLPSLRGKTAEVKVLDATDLVADTSRCGSAGSPTKVVRSFENNLDRRKCKFISPSELESVISGARKNPRTKPTTKTSEHRLDKVFIIGASPLDFAKAISDDIRIVEECDADKICKLIAEENPSCVLWGSDSAGKITAATVAARLELGLCADCTALEFDGKELFMYRPAFGGNIIAKIKSTSRPAMATVRCVSDLRPSVVIGVGMGAKNYLEQVQDFAKRIGADVGASRLMVDHDFLPYESQIGLTGKCVSADVYIAIGISGAVHHIAGIRSSGKIIAINPDSSAPIFDYADYGIVAKVEDLSL